MEALLPLIQLAIAMAMIDVWLVRYERPVLARAGNATTMSEEFRIYGLPDWFRETTRALKLSSAVLLVAGIWVGWAAIVSGATIAILMVGAVAMHIKVGDSWYKSVPAGFFLLLSGYVTYAQVMAVGA